MILTLSKSVTEIGLFEMSKMFILRRECERTPGGVKLIFLWFIVIRERKLEFHSKFVGRILAKRQLARTSLPIFPFKYRAIDVPEKNQNLFNKKKTNFVHYIDEYRKKSKCFLFDEKQTKTRIYS